ncbi:uncharacterized mitochondrial protein AtMg00820-like [Nicotiana sylvestris]|uniref:uncharacterized mitochondrial protein AtMg00820-like n=1 Tax=Nicotiana sylvestris TaxID=4096 RepID=UPI00388C8C71
MPPDSVVHGQSTSIASSSPLGVPLCEDSSSYNMSDTSAAPSRPGNSIVPPMHGMVTRAQTGYLKPKRPFSFLATTLVSPEPSCYSQAAKDVNWHRAMSEEYNALIQNGTWQLIPPSPSQNVIGCRWVCKTKLKADESLDRYKARLVAKGYHQRPGVDFLDTCHPVIMSATIRLLLSLAVTNQWHTTQLDISNAFLYSHLDEIVYMSQPPGFVDPTRPDHFAVRDLGTPSYFLG